MSHTRGDLERGQSRRHPGADDRARGARKVRRHTRGAPAWTYRAGRWQRRQSRCPACPKCRRVQGSGDAVGGRQRADRYGERRARSARRPERGTPPRRGHVGASRRRAVVPEPASLHSCHRRCSARRRRCGDRLVRESLVCSRQVRDRFAFVYALVPLAAAAGLKGNDAWAAKVLGARDAITERTGATVSSNSVRELRDRVEQQAQARLGSDQVGTRLRNRTHRFDRLPAQRHRERRLDARRVLHQFPHPPWQHAAFRTRFIRKHRDVFEQMSRGIAEVDRCGGHPREHVW